VYFFLHLKNLRRSSAASLHCYMLHDICYMKKNWIEKAEKPILALAPMADMTDAPYSQMVRKIGGADIIYREMVSSEALVRDNEKTLKMLDFEELERPLVQQIFGADPLTMARAAEIVMKRVNPDGIDINMGCPVHKITSNFNGCALMKDPENAAKIVSEMKRAIGATPLTVKMRLGWNDPDEFKSFIPVVVEAGAELITIHGRTRSQAYSGVADWGRIKEAKELCTVPLLANGDIHEPEQVKEALSATGADGVMIGRGSLGNPWFFALARDGKVNADISMEERINIVLEHAAKHVAHYGEGSMRTFRKHLAWYFKVNKMGREVPHIKAIRAELMQVNSLEDVQKILWEKLLTVKN